MKHYDKVAHNIIMTFIMAILWLFFFDFIISLFITMSIGLAKEIVDFIRYGRSMPFKKFSTMAIDDLVADIPFIGYILFRLCRS